VTPTKLEIGPGGVSAETLSIARQAALIRLEPRDREAGVASLTGGGLRLVPKDRTGDSGHWASTNDHGEAHVVKVPPGRYRARFNYAWDMDFRREGSVGRGYSKWVELGEVTIPAGRSEHQLRVPPKSEAKADPR